MTSLEAPTPNTVSLGGRASIYELGDLGGGQNSVITDGEQGNEQMAVVGAWRMGREIWNRGSGEGGARWEGWAKQGL